MSDQPRPTKRLQPFLSTPRVQSHAASLAGILFLLTALVSAKHSKSRALKIAVPGTIVKATFLASRQTTSRRGPVSPISRNSTARIPSVADNLWRSGRRTLDRDRRPRILDSRSVETKVACTRGFVAPHTPTVGADLCRWRRTGSMGCVQSKATGRPRPPSLCLHVYTASKHL